MNDLIEIRAPDLGSSGPLTVIECMVGRGDAVDIDTPLITLESDKATMDVPSTAKGRIAEIVVAKGWQVSTGDLIARVMLGGASSPPQPPVPAPVPAPETPISKEAPTPPFEPAPSPATLLPPSPPSGAPEEKSVVRAGPAARRLARELGVDLSFATGSGRGGRITCDDIKSFVKQRVTSQSGGTGPGAVTALPPIPVVDFAAFGPTETRPLTRVQRISGPRLHASWVNLPHVTQFEEADITDLEKLRVSLKPKMEAAVIKLTVLAFMIRACANVLQRFPRFNSSLTPDGQNLVLKRYVHIGFAADTPNGLVVPVVRDADRLDVYRIARRLAEMSESARKGRLSGADMQGGSFTVSSLGGIGGVGFTPIINAPEVAILGVARAAMQPVWQGDRFVPRLVVPLSLSYDHRVIDGADGARFITALREELADARALLEAIP